MVDEYMNLVRRREENERPGVEQDATADGAPLDSYFEPDFEDWEYCQGELSSSVTAGLNDGAGLVGLPPLPVIVDVDIKISKDVRSI